MRELLTLPPDEFSVLLTEMRASEAAGGLVSRAAARLLQKAEKERSGVISSAQSHTHFLDSPRMEAVLARSTVDLRTLASASVTCYLILPPDRLPTYRRWLRLMLACCLLTLTREIGYGRQRRPAHRVLFLLDEFAHLGRMHPVERDFALVAGYGVSFWLLLQDLAQLKADYAEQWASFVANADILQAFGTADYDTADYLSKLTGDATIHVESDNRSRGVSVGRSGSHQQSAARTVSETARRLLLPTRSAASPRASSSSSCGTANRVDVGQLARTRGYVGRGNCPGGVAPVGKIVLAMPGDTVEFTPVGMRLDGRVVPRSAPQPHDRSGRSLPHVMDGPIVVPKGAVVLYAPETLSFDARYYGPTQSAGIRAVVRPLWTSTP